MKRDSIIQSDFSLNWASVFENVGWGISMTSSDNKFLRVNKAFLKMHGGTAEDYVGQSVSSTFTPEFVPRFEQLINEVAEKGHLIYESQHVRRDGSIFPVITEVTAFYNEAREVICWTAIYRDISKEKAAEEEVRRSELQFRTLAESLPQLVWVTNAQGNTVYFNPQWIDYTGIVIANANRWTEAIHPEDAERVNRAWQKCVREHEPYSVEYRLREQRTGEYRWFSSRGYPMRDETGQVIRWFGTCTDIQDLKKTQAELISLVRAREEFLSLASHELKTPLTTLRLQNDVLTKRLEDVQAPALTHDELLKISANNDQQITRLARLVDDMLDITRLISGHLRLELAEHNINEVVRSCVERLTPLYERLGASVPCVDDYFGEAVVVCDRMRIEQVIENILTNSLKYGRGLPVFIKLSCAGRFLEVSVFDRGVGIPSKDQQRIFDRFYRGDVEPMIGGLGLGLFICKEIVDQHGGCISVSSEPGVGSNFVVSLPLKT